MPPAGKAVHLDTSFLIRALVAGSVEAGRLRQWLRDRRPVAVSSLVWGEFLCGLLDEVAIAVAGRIARRHVPVGTREATEAARLFNHGGRRRGSFPHCVIVATAMVAGAELATSNPADFQRFRGAGLELAG
jgi:predicted nucleic acid-binding protein